MSQKSTIELEKFKKIVDPIFFDIGLIPARDAEGRVSRDTVEKQIRTHHPDAQIVWTGDRTCDVTLRIPTNFVEVKGEIRV